MKKGAPWFWALCLGLFCIALPHAARAGEFCPARISKVENVTGAASSFAVVLNTDSQRTVTGQLLLETDNGWYRAPFAPVSMQKAARGFDAPPIYVDLPKVTLLRNVWLAQAASDDPRWGPRGIVNCPPDPERNTARGNAPNAASASQRIAAQPIAPPLSYDCKTPFADAKPDETSFEGDDLGVGDYAAAEVDLDASGAPIGVTALTASGEDFDLKKRLEDRVKRMRFSPAVAYCKPVPSTYIIREAGVQ